MNHPAPKARWLSRTGIRRTGIYWLPNAITTCALFAGFYAIVQAMNLQFELAAKGIFAAMVFDGLDGRVARLTRTQSEFGAEYDSLSDMVSFGAAPALVIYEWSLKGMDKLGWFAAFVYCACAALRLARFNSRSATQDKNYFEGLPSPAAAAVVAALIWLASDQTNVGLPGLVLAFVVTASAGALMISRFAFNSFKQVNVGAKVRFTYIVFVPLAFVLIFLHPAITLLLMSGLYALSAPSLWVFRKLRRRNRAVAQHE